MATLTLQDASAGLGDVQLAAASGGGDDVPSGTHVGGWALPVALLVNNGGASPITITVPGLPAPVSVPASALGIIPVAGKAAFGDLVSVIYSAVTSVTVAAVKLLKVREE